nr:aldehyde ferredoxin oxidoreductase C-terminal domain-containing protein [Thermus scotoductus]
MIGVGVTIATAMEAVEKGYLDDEGLGLRFGNGDALIAAIEKLARREGRLAGWEKGSVDPERLRALGLEEFTQAY